MLFVVTLKFQCIAEMVLISLNNVKLVQHLIGSLRASTLWLFCWRYRKRTIQSNMLPVSSSNWAEGSWVSKPFAPFGLTLDPSLSRLGSFVCAVAHGYQTVQSRHCTTTTQVFSIGDWRHLHLETESCIKIHQSMCSHVGQLKSKEPVTLQCQSKVRSMFAGCHSHNNHSPFCANCCPSSHGE